MDPPCFLVCPGPAAEGLYHSIPVPGGTGGDSGADLRFPADVTVPPSGLTGSGVPTLVDLDVRVRCLAQGAPTPYLLVARSSIGKTPLFLANSVGVIDRGYMGNLKVAIHNLSDAAYVVKRGTSLFQVVRADLEPACVLVTGAGHAAFSAASTRGDGGFGSTGLGGAGAHV